jgi:hypothetical protein
MHRLRRQPASRTRALRRGAGVLLLAIVVAGAYLVLRETGPLPRSPAQTIDAGAPDPFAYSEGRREQLEDRAASGLSHVLYAKSPGGIVASARRTARWRPLIEEVASEGGLDPDLLEAIVLLESAGRSDAVADPQLEGAVGLTQILAGTGQSLLDMRVEVRSSRRLTRRIARAKRAGRESRARALAAARRRVDERFDPRAALEGTARYLSFARGELGRDDLAVVSYHMGVGNLDGVIDAFGEQEAPSYARLFFDSTPARHAVAHRRLRGLGDDSSTYYWRVLAAREIMRLLGEDPAELDRRAELQTAKNSAEEVLHPDDETERFADPDALEGAWRDGEVRTFPDAPRRTGLKRDRRMGELARRLERGRGLYRGLRPEAYALALYLARMVREGGGGRAPLTVTSTVRDQSYQALLARGNPEATGGYSLHTTGWTFDVSREYASGAQAEAFQSALDRLTALDLIAWVREPAAIHITVSSDAEALLPLLEE